MPYQDEDRVKAFILRYQQRVFALVLYLIGGDQDRAYDIAVFSFAEAINNEQFLEQEGIVFTKIVKIAVEKSKNTKAMPTLHMIAVMNLGAEERKSLGMVQTVLQALPFETKALLLLRDQLHLAYSDISFIMHISEHNAKIQTIQARANLRKNIEEALNRAG